MAKFYVQSGTLQIIVHAASTDRAALWAVHQTLAQVLPIFDDHELSAQEKQAVASFRGMQVLDEEIRISEQGFDRADAEVFRTTQLVTEWSQLVIALEKLYEVAEREAEEPQMCLAV
jgi:hypothetical protein